MRFADKYSNLKPETLSNYSQVKSRYRGLMENNTLLKIIKGSFSRMERAFLIAKSYSNKMANINILIFDTSPTSYSLIFNKFCM